MTATVLDSRRRLVMPPELPARSAVIVERVDDDTWLVRRAKRSKYRMVMLLPDVKHLPDDPEWQKTESKFVADSNKGLSPFEE
jgi:hypothetical protein